MFILFCSLPEHIYLKVLGTSDAKLINDEWPYAFEGSEKFIRNQIVLNGGWALTSPSGNYMAWGIQNNYGGIGAIHTVKEHRRKGLGALITKIVGKEIAKKGMDVFSVTSDGNFSEIMMLNIGFKTIARKSWILIKENDKFYKMCFIHPYSGINIKNT